MAALNFDPSKTTLVVALGCMLLGVLSCDENRTRYSPPDSQITKINYEDLAQNIDEGRIGAYENKQLKVVGHIRMFLDLPSGHSIALGERLAGKKYPTILCVLSPTDVNAIKFRGTMSAEGLYESAFPDRLVAVDMLFTGRIGQLDEYGGKNCVVN